MASSTTTTPTSTTPTSTDTFNEYKKRNPVTVSKKITDDLDATSNRLSIKELKKKAVYYYKKSKENREAAAKKKKELKNMGLTDEKILEKIKPLLKAMINYKNLAKNILKLVKTKESQQTKTTPKPTSKGVKQGGRRKTRRRKTKRRKTKRKRRKTKRRKTKRRKTKRRKTKHRTKKTKKR